MKENIKKVITDFFTLRKEYKAKIAAIPSKKQRILMQIPNMLTLARPLSLLAILPTALLGHFHIALALIILSATTDFYDGKIARKYNAESEYGRKLDPVCDKIFAIGLALPILSTHPLLILPTILLEISIASINFASEARQNKPKSTILGKVKTAALSAELIAFYLHEILPKLNISFPITNTYPFIVIAGGMQLAATIQYGYIDNKKQKKKLQLENSSKLLETQTSKKVKTIQQEILEYKHLKETLIDHPEIHHEKTKTIGTL